MIINNNINTIQLDYSYLLTYLLKKLRNYTVSQIKRGHFSFRHNFCSC